MNSASASVRIICIGNRLVAGDDLGPCVYDWLARYPLPEHWRLIDGGLQGLNLLGSVDGARRVVFVDALTGVAPSRAIRVSRKRALGGDPRHFDHGAGLSYLLRAMAVGCDEPPPAWSVVGAAGPAAAAVVQAVAALALSEAARPVRRCRRTAARNLSNTPG